MDVQVEAAPEPSVEALDFEVVERKGRGHPDTLCDAMAEEVSRALTRLYVERAGEVLHHNVDKVLLRGGEARVSFGAGEILEPMEVFLAGRATRTAGALQFPIDDVALDAARAALTHRLHALDPERHVRIRSLIRPGSAALVDVFGAGLRQGRRANDTSIGVGFWPPTPLEKTVLAVEHRLTASDTIRAHPEIGEDVKVMGLRRKDRFSLIVAGAACATHVPNVHRYESLRQWVRELCEDEARSVSGREVPAVVNSADDLARGVAYLTVTGTSAEAGDDGQTGRGNRVHGLISPFRPTSLEAAAGKNPVTHVGKLYQVLAHRIARAVVEELKGIQSAECCLLGRIGRPVEDPEAVRVGVRSDRHRPEAIRAEVTAIARRLLERASTLYLEFLTGQIPIF